MAYLLEYRANFQCGGQTQSSIRVQVPQASLGHSVCLVSSATDEQSNISKSVAALI